ncbi:TPA: hypothetical protein ACOB6O_000812, partial [Neisseria gonorrhoeae]
TGLNLIHYTWVAIGFQTAYIQDFTALYRLKDVSDPSLLHALSANVSQARLWKLSDTQIPPSNSTNPSRPQATSPPPLRA